LRRIIIIGVALASLIGAGVAYAELNTYTASFTFSGSAGTAAKPSPTGFKEVLTAKSTTNGNRAAPLVNLKTKIYGLKMDQNDFPTCSQAKIAAAKNDTGCPKGALIATGSVVSRLGPGSTLVGVGSPCHPYLDVWNGGGNKIVYFFKVVPPTYTCLTLTTGASAPWVGTTSTQGKYSVQNVPLPPDISTEAGGLKGVYGSLITETVNWKKLTTKKHGKTVSFFSSIGCQGKKRPFSVTYTAVNGSAKETQTVTGSAKC